MTIDEMDKGFDSIGLWRGTVFYIVSLSRVITSCNFLYTCGEVNSLAHNLVK